MGVSTRSSRQRRQAGLAVTIGLTALLFCTAAQAAINQIAATDPDLPSSNPGTLTQIEIVAEGSEQLAVSARFSQDASFAAQNIDWTIHSETGQLIYQGQSEGITLPLPPGSYVVEAAFGNAHAAQIVTLATGTKLTANLVLNAGALRIAPHPDAPGVEQPAISIYASSGLLAGSEIPGPIAPGQVIKLATGSYRIETAYPNGNAKAVTVVDVLPGIIRSVDIAMPSGLVRFSLPDGSANAEWTVAGSDGDPIRATGTIVQLVLRPGNYAAEARMGDLVMTKNFTVTDGSSLVLDFKQ